MIILFAIVALIMLASALGVVLFRNPLQSALSLILHLISVAALYAMLEAHFLATVQIVVYAGAIMVLVLFVVMLLNIKVEKPRPIGRWFLAAGILALGGFAAIVLPVLQNQFERFPDPVLPLVGGAQEIGRVLYTQYLFPFEIASVLIFVAIAGAVMIAKRKYGPTAIVATSQPVNAEDR